VHIEVEDTGIGIRAEDQGRLFTAFTQLEGATRQQEGSGLGLHLSQRLAGLLGGTIVVRSEYGKGSVFILMLRS
jgi:protein-histidine pros-kinase